MDYGEYLQAALDEAKRGSVEGNEPVGSVIVASDGTIIARGHNRARTTGDLTAHAEVDAIRNAGELLLREPHQGACTLFTTVEPCLMCVGAILVVGIHRVVWAIRGWRGVGVRDLQTAGVPTAPPMTDLQYVAEPVAELREASRSLLYNWFTQLGDAVKAQRWQG